MAQVATREETVVARSLSVLEVLIKETFEQAEQAGMPYYEKAGALLNEARDGHFKGDLTGFYSWAEKKFGKTQGHLRTYMSLSRKLMDNPRKTFTNLDDFKRRGLGHKLPHGHHSGLRREWTGPVDEVAERAHEEARRLALQDSLTRTQEREAERKLALRLIDIGFKVLAKELHPDKLGGDRDAMTRLNRVRKRLQECI